MGNNVVMSVLSHLGVFLLPVVLPLIVYLSVGQTDPEVRQHSREALNFQISLLIVWFGGFVLVFAGMFAFVLAFASPLGFALFPVMLLVYFGAIGLSIYGAVQAGRRQPWRYPVSIRFVGRGEA